MRSMLIVDRQCERLLCSDRGLSCVCNWRPLLASELPFNAAAPTTSGKKSWPQKPGRFSSPCAV